MSHIKSLFVRDSFFGTALDSIYCPLVVDRGTANKILSLKDLEKRIRRVKILNMMQKKKT